MFEVTAVFFFLRAAPEGLLKRCLWEQLVKIAELLNLAVSEKRMNENIKAIDIRYCCHAQIACCRSWAGSPGL